MSAHHGSTRPVRRSHLMHVALDLLAAGVAPRDAAARAGVTLQALYRAMRADGIGTRCPTCHKLAGRTVAATAATAAAAAAAAAATAESSID